MAVDSKLAEQVQAEMAQLLEKYGIEYRWGDLKAQHPEIPRSTFYRWLRRIHGSGVPSQNAIRKARKKAKRKAKKAGGAAKVKEQTIRQVKEQLPVLPDMPDEPGGGLTITDLLDRLKGCVERAEQLETHALGTDGKVRNAKLLLQASEHMRRTAETIAKLNAMLWDVQRVETLHNAMFKRIAQRDPELVMLILQDLRQANIDMGIQV